MTKFHDFEWLQIIYVDAVKNVSVRVLVLHEMLIVTHCFPHSLVENLTLNSPTSLFTLSSISSIIKALKVLAPVVQTLKVLSPGEITIQLTAIIRENMGSNFTSCGTNYLSHLW